MWSHEHDSNILRKQEEGRRVWEDSEVVVAWIKGGDIPFFRANCFCGSPSCQTAVSKSVPRSMQCGLGALAPVTRTSFTMWPPEF